MYGIAICIWARLAYFYSCQTLTSSQLEIHGLPQTSVLLPHMSIYCVYLYRNLDVYFLTQPL